jgi:hypothetical protein
MFYKILLKKYLLFFSRIILEELYTRQPKTIKLLIVIAEKRDDLMGRQVKIIFRIFYLKFYDFFL